jgi:hypothetical protein
VIYGTFYHKRRYLLSHGSGLPVLHSGKNREKSPILPDKQYLSISTVTWHAKGIARYDELSVFRTLDHLVKFIAHEIDLATKWPAIQITVPGFQGQFLGHVPRVVVVSVWTGEAVYVSFYFWKGIYCAHRFMNLMKQRINPRL